MDYSSFNYFRTDPLVYSSFNYFCTDPLVYFEIDHDIDTSIYYDDEDDCDDSENEDDSDDLESEEDSQSDEECDNEFKKILGSFKYDDVHKGLGYCPCKSRNHCRRPNLGVHLFKECASVIYGLSCFHENVFKHKLIVANQQVPGCTGFQKIQLADWIEDPVTPGTLVFRIDFVHIQPFVYKYDDADYEMPGIDDIKRGWRQNLYGFVGARRNREEELGTIYPPAGIVFSRDYNQSDHEMFDNKAKLLVSPDGHLLLNGPFVPLVVHPADESMLLDIKLVCHLETSEQTVALDVRSSHKRIPAYDEEIQIDQPKTCCLKGSYGCVKVGYSIISRAVYVRFVASIVIPSTASPLDIYGYITVDEHFHGNKKSYLFYAERDSYQHLKHGDYLSLYMDSMTLREGRELTINVSLYQRSPSSTSKSDDIIFVEEQTSFYPTLSTNEEESQQEKKILCLDDDKEQNGINFMIGIIDPRSIFILQP